MNTSLPIFIVDAFVGDGLLGNAAGVCFLTEELPTPRMQRIALEMNQSETAFVKPTDNGRYSIRWMTPTTEVDLCGHATLAAAKVMVTNSMVKAGEMIEFESRSGILRVSTSEDLLVLDFPSTAPVSTDAFDVRTAIGLDGRDHSRSTFDFLIRVDSEEEVLGIEPNLPAIRSMGGRGLVVTAPASRADFDIVSRCFFPAVGIDEDSVTGSAHCMLSPYWFEKLGKTRITALQASERGGRLELELQNDRVLLGGRATITLEGKIFL